MGERGNIAIRQRDGGWIYLYTHWEGPSLPSILSAALARKERWDDSSYLARIIFEQMIKDDGMSSTGYGISNKLDDNNYPVLYVDCNRKIVDVGSHDPKGIGENRYGENEWQGEYSFKRFMEKTLNEEFDNFK